MNTPYRDFIMIPLIFIGFLLIVLHIPIFMIIIMFWVSDQIIKKDLEISKKLESLANELKIINKTFLPQKRLSLFSWMVYQKCIMVCQVFYCFFGVNQSGLEIKN